MQSRLDANRRGRSRLRGSPKRVFAAARGYTLAALLPSPEVMACVRSRIIAFVKS
jgi:hypothetical protein